NSVILAVKRRRRRLVDERVQPVKLSTYDQHRFMLSGRYMKVTEFIIYSLTLNLLIKYVFVVLRANEHSRAPLETLGRAAAELEIKKLASYIGIDSSLVLCSMCRCSSANMVFLVKRSSVEVLLNPKKSCLYSTSNISGFASDKDNLTFPLRIILVRHLD
ncbi:hypothetical protein C5167_046400, partial [Papaver somniferum]